MAEVKPEALVAPVNGNDTKPTKSSSYPPYIPPPALPRPPFIDVEGIPNFRNIGGYLCSPYGQSNSHIVRPSFIYRCAHPTLVTPTGSSTLLDDLKISAIYDLRSVDEVAQTSASAGTSTPLPTANGLNAIRQFTPVYTSEDHSPDALARKLAWYSSNAATSSSNLPPYSQGFLNAYRDISEHGITAYKKIFNHILTQPTKPLIFHCTAGKDRTGVIAALILRLCGVDDETISWEYALTEPGLGLWRDIFMQRMSSGGMGAVVSPSSSSGKETTNGISSTTNGETTSSPEIQDQNSNFKSKKQILTQEEAARVCGSRAGNIRAYLKYVVDDEFGSVENYLQNKLGFTDGEIQTIKASLVVPVSELVDPEREVVRVIGIEGWSAEGGVTERFDRSGDWKIGG